MKKATMKYNILRSEEREGIIILTIDREKALNALNVQTIKELYNYFAYDVHAEKQAKGIIITGAGEKSFVAGADIKEFTFLDQDKGRIMSQNGQEVFSMIENFHKPVIAAVNGFALGGGCELAMACHLRVASENARFGQPEVNLGLIPGYGGTQRLVQLIGKGKAMELLMTADMIDASEAYRLGLVNHVVPAGKAVEKSMEILNKISSKGPVAIAKVIECVNAYFSPKEDGFAVEAKLFGKTTGTVDFKEGVTAFIEKRPPAFKGE